MPFNPNKPYTFDRLVRIAFGIALLLAIIWTLDYLSSVLVPFVVALLLAYLINPMVQFFQRRLIGSRVIAVMLSLVICIGGLVGIVVGFIPLIVNELSHTGQLLRSYVENSPIRQSTIDYLPESFEKFVEDLAARPEVRDMFNTENVSEVVDFLGENVLPGVLGVFSGSINLLIGILGLTVILLYLVFILIDYDRIMDGWAKYIPIAYRDTITTLVGDVNVAMNQYFRAQAFIAAIMGILFAIGFSLISLPMGIALGLFVGALNMVPYLQLIGLVPAVLLALVHSLETGQSFWVMLLLVILVFGVVQLIQDALLTPRIMGDVTGLNPAVILLSLSIWGKLLGLLGLIIAIPMTTIVVSYYVQFLKLSENVEDNQQAIT